MITEETVKQAVENVYKQNARKYGIDSSSNFHFESFVKGLALGLFVCAIVLIWVL